MHPLMFPARYATGGPIQDARDVVGLEVLSSLHLRIRIEAPDEGPFAPALVKLLESRLIVALEPEFVTRLRWLCLLRT